MVAARGHPWSFRLPYPPGSKMELAVGPAGMRVDAEARTLSWDVPASARHGPTELLLNVIDPAGVETYKRLYVTVR